MNPIIAVLIFSAICLSGISYASESDAPVVAQNGAKSLYDQGVEASHNNDFQKALPLFEQALQADPNNPDILNMLAHAQRKTGSIDEAIDNYKKALQLRPKFPEAHEYLGEAYIQAAMREAAILKGYGSDGQEELEDLTSDTKEAAAKL